MATIILSAVGAAVGSGFGGTLLGLSGAVVGRAVGATIGMAIDQKIAGSGSSTVEGPRIDQFRLTGAREGAPVARVWGRMRVAGQVIWSTRFAERKRTETTTQGGGKGATPTQTTTSTTYSYSVSMAMALCEGEILRVGRIWADGQEIAPADLNMRVYRGTRGQLPDPRIEAVEGMAPAYRGIAYVVIEDLQLERFGNRVPQFTFEVVRAAQGANTGAIPDLTRGIEAVALVPGTGEYALATTRVTIDKGLGEVLAVNENTPNGTSDLTASLDILDEEAPNCRSVSLVVSWFGDDLRAHACQVMPKVEYRESEGTQMPWVVSGLGRAGAVEVPRQEGKPVYGGTPADGAVIEAIRDLRRRGKRVMFYPFVLMDQLAGNGLADPWTGAASQPALPWRGRITLSKAPGTEGSPDGGEGAEAQVAAFFGQAARSDFEPHGETVRYSGGAEWSFRRMILHYAHLCALAGGVHAFCIGSELRGLTQIRGRDHGFPAVAQLRRLAADCRAILGPQCRIGYAADWSEYFGYDHPNGNRYYPLDPLWADAHVDFVGIDNYMPLSDWRDGEEHADARWGSIHDLDYLKSNIEGGEGYDWYYADAADREAQIRTPIFDSERGESWIWRCKDIRNWWSKRHHERIGGVWQAAPTPWVPESKPVWFTEMGCAAIDKGTNEPNRFLDPKSAESGLPHHSDGRRDELIQMQYLRAMTDYWSGPKNPASSLYAGRMIDMSNAYVWAWDARPYPQFPANVALWSDAENYPRGHWLGGRLTAQPLEDVVGEICAAAGLTAVDTSELQGRVIGYSLAGGETARAALQSLMLAYGFDTVERGGKVVFRMRRAQPAAQLGEAALVRRETGDFERLRSTEAEVTGRMRLAFIDAENDYNSRAAETAFPDESARAAGGSEMPLALTRAEGLDIVERWLSEARVARDAAKFSLPPSLSWLGAGDVVEITLGGRTERYRIDRAEEAGALEIEAIRVEPGVYRPAAQVPEPTRPKLVSPGIPVTPIFLDLPLLSGEEDPYAPHLAVAAQPWPGPVAVYASSEDDGYGLNTTIRQRAVIGRTLSDLPRARAGVWDRGVPLRVQVKGGDLESASLSKLLSGANGAAIGSGDDQSWEVFQFADAVLVGPKTWELSMRLRGQAGTDALMPALWPAGSLVVFLDGAPEQIRMKPAQRGVERHYRIGAAKRPVSDRSYRHLVEAFAGVGLRPLSPVHLRTERSAGGVILRWIRRTRIDGDSWDGVDVPLGEGSEQYLVRIFEQGEMRREEIVPGRTFIHTAAMRAADVSGPYEMRVAQLSEVYGPGPFARISIDG